MTGQHELLWKSGVKAGASEGYAIPAPHGVPVMMSPMSYQGMKSTNIKDKIKFSLK